ncbi:MAG TPA: hypothetical protein VGO01_13160 [Bradyrhizobium sp.]|jgi:hypothetical protein|nr:hypothetical protein [Bradyrhizobium sp.]
MTYKPVEEERQSLPGHISYDRIASAVRSNAITAQQFRSIGIVERLIR